MAKVAKGQVPREPVPGMPDDLADAVFTRYSPETAEEVLANWDAIGVDGQALYRRYLDRALTRRGRRERCGLAAAQLYRPDEPLPTPSVGGGG